MDNKPEKKGPKKCMQCQWYILSKTIGSPDIPIWHCMDGFTPSRGDNFCQELAEYNRKNEREHTNQRGANYYKRGPGIQLEIPFE